MRQFFLILFCLTTFLKINSQTLRQGNVTVNAYYGYNVFTAFVTKLAQSSNSGALPRNITISSIGPVGITSEYLLNNMLGVGGEIGFSQTKLIYDLEGTDNAGILSNYNYVWTVSTTRVMGRVNIHFGDTPNFDVYPFIGAGLRFSSTSLKTNDPNLPLKLRANFFPFGVKPGLGMRYFISPNIGVHAEIALGTPIILAGISFKFNNPKQEEN